MFPKAGMTRRAHRDGGRPTQTQESRERKARHRPHCLCTATDDRQQEFLERNSGEQVARRLEIGCVGAGVSITVPWEKPFAWWRGHVKYMSAGCRTATRPLRETATSHLRTIHTPHHHAQTTATSRLQRHTRSGAYLQYVHVTREHTSDTPRRRARLHRGPIATTGGATIPTLALTLKQLTNSRAVSAGDPRKKDWAPNSSYKPPWLSLHMDGRPPAAPLAS